VNGEQEAGEHKEVDELAVSPPGSGPRTEQRKPGAFSDPVVWVSCPYGEATPSVKEVLEALEATGSAYLHYGKERPRGENLSAVVLYLNGGEDVASEMDRVRRWAPGVPVLLFLGSPEDLASAREALKEGAHGLLHGGMQPEQVACALASASRWKVAIPQEILLGLAAAEEEEGHGAGGPLPASALTPQQREVLGLVSKSLSDGQVARRLSLPERTVKRELHAAYRTLRYKRKIKEAIVYWHSNKTFSPKD
jgi:DNA-binding NarL/FixJ family response regulator